MNFNTQEAIHMAKFVFLCEMSDATELYMTFGGVKNVHY